MYLKLSLLLAAAVGVVADLFGMGDAYNYAARMHASNRGWYFVLPALFVVPLFLNMLVRRTLPMTAAVWAGMAVSHTVLLIGEITADPTSHNLWPFEYVFIGLLTLPALLGAAAGRFAGQVWVPGGRSRI